MIHERSFLAMSRDDMKKAYIAAIRAHRLGDITGCGFEVVDATADQLLTPDGREILRAHGRAWALRPEIHAKRLGEATEQARKRDAAMAEQKSQPAQTPSTPTVCSALIDGQLCGGNLVRAAVCPRCALGKSGVAATLTCDVCGHVSAIMRGES